jgi:hypothetical protein
MRTWQTPSCAPAPSRWLIAAVLILLGLPGCASLRVTQPPQTADEQFLLSQATAEAIARLSVSNLRGRRVYVSFKYLGPPKTLPSQPFLEADLRSHLLKGGVLLCNHRKKSQIVLEVRCGAMGINQYDLLIGIPQFYAGNVTASNGSYGIPLLIPQLAILKNTKQQGFASVAYVAYWRKTGDIVASSGPFLGRTERSDWWFLGFGPQTSGNIPPVQHP